MSGQVVPFGKYKGQPGEALLADRDYCEWLLAQPWFKDKFAPTYNLIVNYGGEPQESPEHNQMQARFLDDECCFALARLLWPRHRDQYDLGCTVRVAGAEIPEILADVLVEDHTPMGVDDRAFERDGWDVVFRIRRPRVWLELDTKDTKPPYCACGTDHTVCAPSAACRGGTGLYCTAEHYEQKREEEQRRWREGKPIAEDCRHVEDVHNDPCCVWADERFRTWVKRLVGGHELSATNVSERLVRVELKPDLGDDYPSVLRQVLRYPADPERGERQVVIARRSAFEHVTWEQVVQMFAASNVTLLREAELDPGVHT